MGAKVKFFTVLAIMAMAGFLASDREPQAQGFGSLSRTHGSFTSKGDTVNCNGYGISARPIYSMGSVWPLAGTTTPVFSFGTTDTLTTSREYLIVGNKASVRQDGTVLGAEFFLRSPGPDVPGELTGFFVVIWRRNGSGTYDAVGRSHNMVLDLIFDDAAHTYYFDNPITGVQTGDFYGLRWEFNKCNGPVFFAGIELENVVLDHREDTFHTYAHYNEAYDSTLRDFEDAPTNDYDSGIYTMAVNLKMVAPQGVLLGNSILAGHTKYRSPISSGLQWPGMVDSMVADSMFSGRFIANSGYTIQNMSQGGAKFLSNLARFDTDVVALHPAFCIMDGGGNDVNTAGYTLDAIREDVDSLLIQAYINDIIMYVVEPTPQEYSDSICTRLDSIVTTMREAVLAAPGEAYWIPSRVWLGEADANGPGNNLWDLIDIYADDYAHLTRRGSWRLADGVWQEMQNRPSSRAAGSGF